MHCFVEDSRHHPFEATGPTEAIQCIDSDPLIRRTVEFWWAMKPLDDKSDMRYELAAEEVLVDKPKGFTYKVF